jgi:DNA-binding transcriptional LysR family regulator
MEVFARVVEAGSFAGAAERLGLSRGAASKHIMQLEARIGVQLLNRTTRRLSLTEEGRAYYERCLRILADVEEAEREAGEATGKPRGTLRLSAPVSFGLLHLGSAVHEFAQINPAVRVELSLDDRVADLVKEGFDAAIRIGRLADSSLVGRRLCGTRLVVAAAPGYWHERGKPAAPAALAGHACLHYTLQSGGAEWRFRDRSGGEHVVRAAGPLAANNGDVLRAAALAGAGVALLPDFIIGPDLQSGALESVLDEYAAPKFGVHVVYPPSRQVPLKLRAWVDFLAARFAPRPPWAA